MKLRHVIITATTYIIYLSPLVCYDCNAHVNAQHWVRIEAVLFMVLQAFTPHFLCSSSHDTISHKEKFKRGVMRWAEHVIMMNDDMVWANGNKKLNCSTINNVRGSEAHMQVVWKVTWHMLCYFLTKLKDPYQNLPLLYWIDTCHDVLVSCWAMGIAVMRWSNVSTK